MKFKENIIDKLSVSNALEKLDKLSQKKFVVIKIINFELDTLYRSFKITLIRK